ncbi:MAG: hypothetical protein J6X16_02825 [Bacteroidales bacterium]|nr:hypothetical protein [Bacteroidales bacterium]
MKKLFTLTLALVASISFAFAQYVSEGPVTLLKTQVNGFTINIPKADSKSATTAISEYLAENGLVKPKTEDKYTSYKAQKLASIGDGTYDIYFKAVQKGKKKDVSSDIIFVCSLGNLNTISSSNDNYAANNIKTLVSKFPSAVEKYMLKQKIEDLKKQIESSNKEKAKNDKEIKKLQDKMSKANEKHNDLNKQLQDATNTLKNYTID